jgi:hypothetical protein
MPIIPPLQIQTDKDAARVIMRAHGLINDMNNSGVTARANAVCITLQELSKKIYLFPQGCDNEEPEPEAKSKEQPSSDENTVEKAADLVAVVARVYVDNPGESVKEGLLKVLSVILGLQVNLLKLQQDEIFSPKLRAFSECSTSVAGSASVAGSSIAGDPISREPTPEIEVNTSPVEFEMVPDI